MAAFGGFGGAGGFGAAPAGGAAPFGGAPGGFGAAPGAPAFNAAPAATPGFGGAAGGFAAAAPLASPGGFGAAASPVAAFGGAAGGFGAQPAAATGAFGAPAAGGFGASAAQAPGGFGAQQQAPTAFGGFTNPAAGNAGAFGSPPPAPRAGAFGAPASPGAFGAAAGAFGAPTTAGAAGAFGGGAFGGAAAGGFGASASPTVNTGGAFGAPAAAGGAFGGGAAVGGGAFGQPQQQQQQAAGAGSTTGKFQATLENNNSGTLQHECITMLQQFKPYSLEELRLMDRGQGGGSGAAPGAVGGAPATPGAFGGGSPGVGAFGAAPAAAPGLFGSPQPGAAPFGQQPQQQAFGAAPGAAPFGSPQQAAPGGFGAPAAFGAAAAPAAAAPGGFGGFGAPAAGAAPGGFGTPAAFGASAAPAAAAPGGFGGFGAAAPAAPGGFGVPQPAGAPPAAAPGAFGFGSPGAAAAPGGFGGFGQQKAASPAAGGFGFGAAAPGAPAAGGFGNFGAKPAPLLGAAPGAAPGALGFGAGASPAKSAAGAFGFGAAAAPSATPGAVGGFGAGAFGAGAAAPAASAGFGGFGAGGLGVPGAAPGGFGGFAGLGGAAPAAFPASGSGGLALGGAAAAAAVAKEVPQTEKEMSDSLQWLTRREKVDKASGASAQQGGITLSSAQQGGSGGGPTANFENGGGGGSGYSSSSLGSGAGGVAQLAMHGTGSSLTPFGNISALSGGGGGGGRLGKALGAGGLLTSRSAVGSSGPRIRPGGLSASGSGMLSPEASSRALGRGNNLVIRRHTPQQGGAGAAGSASPLSLTNGGGGGGGGAQATPTKGSSSSLLSSPALGGGLSTPDPVRLRQLQGSSGSGFGGFSPRSGATPRSAPRSAGGGAVRPTPVHVVQEDNGGSNGGDVSVFAPLLTKPCYVTQPPLHELQRKLPSELDRVEGFSVTKVHPTTGERVGTIEWLEAVDVTHANLDDDVEIVNEEVPGKPGKRRWSVSVYGRKRESDGDYPRQGTKLNGRARITFYNVTCKSAKKVATYEASLAEKLGKLEPPGTDVRWDSSTDVLTYEVPHWTRYLIEDSDSEDEEEGDKEQGRGGASSSKQQLPPFSAGGAGFSGGGAAGGGGGEKAAAATPAAAFAGIEDDDDSDEGSGEGNMAVDHGSSSGQGGDGGGGGGGEDSAAARLSGLGGAGGLASTPFGGLASTGGPLSPIGACPLDTPAVSMVSPFRNDPLSSVMGSGGERKQLVFTARPNHRSYVESPLIPAPTHHPSPPQQQQQQQPGSLTAYNPPAAATAGEPDPFFGRPQAHDSVGQRVVLRSGGMDDDGDAGGYGNDAAEEEEDDEADAVLRASCALPPVLGLPLKPPTEAAAKTLLDFVPRYFPAAQSRSLALFEEARRKVAHEAGISSVAARADPTRMGLDSSLTMGRSFRASFGPGGVLVLPFGGHAAMLATSKAPLGAVVGLQQQQHQHQRLLPSSSSSGPSSSAPGSPSSVALVVDCSQYEGDQWGFADDGTLHPNGVSGEGDTVVGSSAGYGMVHGVRLIRVGAAHSVVSGGVEPPTTTTAAAAAAVANQLPPPPFFAAASSPPPAFGAMVVGQQQQQQQQQGGQGVVGAEESPFMRLLMAHREAAVMEGGSETATMGGTSGGGAGLAAAMPHLRLPRCRPVGPPSSSGDQDSTLEVGEAVDEKEYPQLVDLIHRCIELTSEGAKLGAGVLGGGGSGRRRRSQDGNRHDDGGGSGVNGVQEEEGEEDDAAGDGGEGWDVSTKLAVAEEACEWSTAHMWRLARALWGQEHHLGQPTGGGAAAAAAAAAAAGGAGTAAPLPVTKRCPASSGPGSGRKLGRHGAGSRRVALLQQWLQAAVRGRSAQPALQRWRGPKVLNSRQAPSGSSNGSNNPAAAAAAEASLLQVLDLLSEGRLAEASHVAHHGTLKPVSATGERVRSAFSKGAGAGGAGGGPRSPRLAMVIAGCGGDGVKTLVARQLAGWRANGALEHVPPALVLAYTLMVGDPRALLTVGLVSTPHAPFPPQQRHMGNMLVAGGVGEEAEGGNDDEALFARDPRLCFRKDQRTSLSCNLDWMRRVGLGAWFGSGSGGGGERVGAAQRGEGGGGSSVVSASLQEYTAAAQAGLAAPPLPLYRARRWHADQEVAMALLRDRQQRAKQGGGGRGRAGGGGAVSSPPPPPPQHCVLFHLLECYCLLGQDESSEQALTSALSPHAVTADKLDFRHSFQLLTLLEALGLYESELGGPRVKAAVLDGLAEQLEAGGRWEWAVYVQLHHDDPHVRLRTCRQLLLRHAHENPGGFVLPDGSQRRIGRAAFLCGGSNGGGGVDSSSSLSFGGLGLPRALLDEALSYWSGYGSVTGFVNVQQPSVECGAVGKGEGEGVAGRRAEAMSTALSAATCLLTDADGGGVVVDEEAEEEEKETLCAEVQGLALKAACGEERLALGCGRADAEAWKRATEDALLLSWVPRFAVHGDDGGGGNQRSQRGSLSSASPFSSAAISVFAQQRAFLDAALCSLPSSAIVPAGRSLPTHNSLLRAYAHYLDVRLALEHHTPQQQQQPRFAAGFGGATGGVTVPPLKAVPALVEGMVAALARGRYGKQLAAAITSAAGGGEDYEAGRGSSSSGVGSAHLAGDTYGAGSYAGGVGAQEALECQRVEMLQFCAAFEQRQRQGQAAVAEAALARARGEGSGGGSGGGDDDRLVASAKGALSRLQAKASAQAALPLSEGDRHAGLQVSLRAFVQAL